jgi:hypothetical protein
MICLPQWFDTVVRHSMINHCDRRIGLLGDTDTVVRHSMINHCDRYICISLFLMILIYYLLCLHVGLSQWVMLCLWLYCISITKKNDMSITVIYHDMSLTTVSVSLKRVMSHSDFLSLMNHCDRHIILLSDTVQSEA